MIPSNLSDFIVYDGICRYLNLVYVPDISIDKVLAAATVDNKTNKGKVVVKTRYCSKIIFEQELFLLPKPGV